MKMVAIPTAWPPCTAMPEPPRLTFQSPEENMVGGAGAAPPSGAFNTPDCNTAEASAAHTAAPYLSSAQAPTTSTSSTTTPGTLACACAWLAGWPSTA